jgi:hypothetical protein
MACTAPLAVLLAWSSFSWLEEIFKPSAWLVNIAGVTILVWLLGSDTKRFQQIQRQRTVVQASVHDMCSFIKEKYPTCKVWFVDPQVGVELQRDPFSGVDAKRYFPSQTDYASSFRDGDLLFWDSHFSPLEGATPLTNFEGNPLFNEVIKSETVREDGTPYSLYLFQCVHSN